MPRVNRSYRKMRGPNGYRPHPYDAPPYGAQVYQSQGGYVPFDGDEEDEQAYYVVPEQVVPVVQRRSRGRGYFSLLGIVLLAGILLAGTWYLVRRWWPKKLELPSLTSTQSSPLPTLLPTTPVTATPTPFVPAPTPARLSSNQPVLETLRVKSDGGLYLWDCLEAGCKAISTVANGTQVSVLSEQVFANNQTWVKVRVNGTEGWVSRYYLE